MTEPDETALLKGTIFELPRRGGKSLVLQNLRQAARIKALEAAIREALGRLNEYADMTLEAWDDTIADNGAACWMLIRAQLKTVVVADLNRALDPETIAKEADE